MRARIKPSTLLGLSIAALALSGCADAGRKFSQSESPLEFAWALAGHEHTEAFPVEKAPAVRGTVATAHAHKDSKGVFVYGTITKTGSIGPVSVAWNHIDVTILGPNGAELATEATSFTPSTIPETYRGIPGKARYFIRLKSEPPPGSKIRVQLHPISRNECETCQLTPQNHSG